jgi:hypothetical protein
MEFIESERGNQKLNMKLIKFVGAIFLGGGAIVLLPVLLLKKYSD